MTKIYKQALLLTDAQTVELPKGARILSAQYQPGGQKVGGLMIWYECDPSAEVEWRTIMIIGTGNSMPDTHKLVYISTTQMGSLVWHVYEAL